MRLRAPNVPTTAAIEMISTVDAVTLTVPLSNPTALLAWQKCNAMLRVASMGGSECARKR